MDKNTIKHPPVQPTTDSEKQEMKLVVERVIELIKEKHL
jgi:hypothetical protein